MPAAGAGVTACRCNRAGSADCACRSSRTWAISWASNLSPAMVCGANRPGAKTTSEPSVYAKAPTARADAAARSSVCIRTPSSRTPERCSKRCRLDGFKGCPPPSPAFTSRTSAATEAPLAAPSCWRWSLPLDPPGPPEAHGRPAAQSPQHSVSVPASSSASRSLVSPGWEISNWPWALPVQRSRHTDPVNRPTCSGGPGTSRARTGTWLGRARTGEPIFLAPSRRGSAARADTLSARVADGRCCEKLRPPILAPQDPSRPPHLGRPHTAEPPLPLRHRHLKASHYGQTKQREPICSPPVGMSRTRNTRKTALFETGVTRACLGAELLTVRHSITTR